jgi:hypothetical protein
VRILEISVAVQSRQPRFSYATTCGGADAASQAPAVRQTLLRSHLFSLLAWLGGYKQHEARRWVEEIRIKRDDDSERED